MLCSNLIKIIQNENSIYVFKEFYISEISIRFSKNLREELCNFRPSYLPSIHVVLQLPHLCLQTIALKCDSLNLKNGVLAEVLQFTTFTTWNWHLYLVLNGLGLEFVFPDIFEWSWLVICFWDLKIRLYHFTEHPVSFEGFPVNDSLLERCQTALLD